MLRGNTYGVLIYIFCFMFQQFAEIWQGAWHRIWMWRTKGIGAIFPGVFIHSLIAWAEFCIGSSILGECIYSIRHYWFWCKDVGKTKFTGHAKIKTHFWTDLWTHVNLIICNWSHELFHLQAQYHGNRNSCWYLGLHRKCRRSSSNIKQDHPSCCGVEGVTRRFIWIFCHYESSGNATGKNLFSLCSKVWSCLMAYLI